MNNKFITFFVGIFTVAVLSYLLGVGIFKNSNKPTASPQIQNFQVTTSFYPLYYFTSEIGGDKTGVKNLAPAGSEPHDYELTTQDRVSIENSKLLILNGGGLEPWGEKIGDELKDKGVSVITVSDDFIIRDIEEAGKKIKDPHVWLSPPLAKKQVEKVTQALSDIDPSNRATYETNAKNLEARLDNLDKSYREGLNNCVRRDFITSHEAFGYLAQAYNLNQVSVSGVSPDEEPSPQQLAEVAKFVRDNNVKYIFFETLVSPKLSETIAKEVGAKTLVLDPIEGLSDDDIKQGRNYFTVMEDNLKNLQIALECKT